MQYENENIYSNYGLNETATIRNFRIVQTEGSQIKIIEENCSALNPVFLQSAKQYQRSAREMWKCPKCGREFKNIQQDHFCVKQKYFQVNMVRKAHDTLT